MFDIGMNAAVVRIAEAAAGGGRGRTKAEPLNTFGPHPTSGGEMKLMEGRFGPYVTDGTTNATLPKTADPATLTLEEAIALIDARAAKGPAKGKKKAAPKKARSEEHTSELQSLMRISYAVFCLKKKKQVVNNTKIN